MRVPKIKLSNLGPIAEADITPGDLTVLVGPQATGKSVFLQVLKLLVDTDIVQATLKQYGREWEKDPARFLDVYLGEGMSRVWNPRNSRILLDGKDIDLGKLVGRQRRDRIERMFYIPAQRVLTLAGGWPRPFSDYSAGDPFAVCDFSEKMRQLLESPFGRSTSLFPQEGRLTKKERALLNDTIFSGFRLQVDSSRMQKRLVLNTSDKEGSLPFMVWSAGQREFVPLLLGLYWLLPPTKVPRRANLDWVVIEEFEMGLHPKAISSVLLLILDLVSRGYRVCLSTHSPHVLDLIWGLRLLQKHQAKPRQVLELFDVRATQQMMSIAKSVLNKEARVYYFDSESKTARDISNLDPGGDDPGERGWGGLTEFSGRVANTVARVVSGAEE